LGDHAIANADPASFFDHFFFRFLFSQS
jgi:hypothetical protein